MTLIDIDRSVWCGPSQLGTQLEHIISVKSCIGVTTRLTPDGLKPTIATKYFRLEWIEGYRWRDLIGRVQFEFSMNKTWTEAISCYCRFCHDRAAEFNLIKAANGFRVCHSLSTNQISQVFAKNLETSVNWLEFLHFDDVGLCLAWRCPIWSSRSAFSRVFWCHPSNNNGSSASCGVTPMPSSLFWYLRNATVQLVPFPIYLLFIWLVGDSSQFSHVCSHRSRSVIHFCFIKDFNCVITNDELDATANWFLEETQQHGEPWSWGSQLDNGNLVT